MDTNETISQSFSQKEGEKLLPALYALRAGLSAISQKKDDLDKDVAEEQAFFAHSAQEKEVAKKRIASLEEKVGMAQGRIESYSRKEIFFSCLGDLGMSSLTLVMWFIIGLPLLLLAAAVVVACIGGYRMITTDYLVEGWHSTDMGFWEGVFYFASVLSPVIIIGAIVCAVLYCRSDFFKEMCEERFEIDFSSFGDWFSRKKKIKEEEDKKASLEWERAIAEKAFREKELLFAAQVHLSKEKQKAARQEAMELFDLLEKQFSPVLNSRDWRNLDLVIHYFETGRADTKKEALQLVDVQRQNDALVGAIKRAGEEIESSIRAGLSALRNDMIRCFSILAEEMSEIHKQQMEKMDAILISNLEISSKMSSIVSSAALNNALLAKANVSSEALMADVNYIKMQTEYTEMRRRNGVQ